MSQAWVFAVQGVEADSPPQGYLQQTGPQLEHLEVVADPAEAWVFHGDREAALKQAYSMSGRAMSNYQLFACRPIEVHQAVLEFQCRT